MSGYDIFGADYLYREIYVKKGAEDWNEIELNPGGIASTLQDVKTHYRSGAYVFKDIPNRFIYWRTESNILELVEESLDVTLHGNQVRYKFTDSQVLEGISVTEISQRVFILVPTVSSLHVFSYPHPYKGTLKRGSSENSSLSLFYGTNENDASDPHTYHHLNCSSSAIVSCCSFMVNNGEGLFALSLANASIMLVILDTISGTSSTRVLTHSTTLVPRLFTGITDALLGKEDGEWVGVNMILHYIQKELFLFALCSGGCLRVWSVNRGCCVSSYSLKSLPGQIKGQKHKMCKGLINGSLVLHCCVQGCAIITLLPIYGEGQLSFTVISEIPIESGLELTYMCPGEEGQLWCSWLTPDESPAITKCNVVHPEFSRVFLTRPSLLVKPSKYIPRDPASLYLNAIFSSGFFNAANIAKALALYKITAVIKPNIDITEQICSIVKAEISSEACDQELDDDEFLDISHRCWSRLYSCCSQYIISSMLPLGMVSLGNELVLTQECGFSLVVEIEPLDPFMTTSAKFMHFSAMKYGWLLERLQDIDLDEGIEKLELSLLTGESLDELSVLRDAVDLIPPSQHIDHALSVFYEEAFESSLNALIGELGRPEEPKDGGTNSFCSYSGVSAVISSFRDYCSIRLKVCEKLVLLMELALREGFEKGQRVQFRSLVGLCRSYYILLWICKAKSTSEVSLIHSFTLANQSSIMQSTLMDSVFALANYLWPSSDNTFIAHHLLSTKQFALLQALARMTGSISWNLLLAESYIITGQPGKAFDVCLRSAGSDVSHFLSAIGLFERYARSDLVISMATKALELLNVSPPYREMLESALFVHELGLGNYDAAWSWIESCSSWSRRSDFLHRLVSSMISEGKLAELISFPYTGLLDELEKFLSSRARSLSLAQAASYYNILYAFHMKHENFKKAARVMLEKALRADTTEMQWRCYGACLSSLMLVSDPLQAWLECPNPFSQEDSIEIIKIEDIQREFELSSTRFNLDNCSPDSTKEEVIALCVTQKYFRSALRLANMYKLSCAPIIQEFTASCAALSEDAITWHWLKNNEIDDFMISEKNAIEMSWRILERCIIKYEKPCETVLHRACANQLLSIGYFLPTWLLRSYKKLNCGELLRLYLRHGYLDEGGELACDYLNAALGTGREDFSIQAPLHPLSPPLWMPLELIDLLILEMKHHGIHEDLEKALNKYIDTAMRLSEEKQKLKYLK